MTWKKKKFNHTTIYSSIIRCLKTNIELEIFIEDTDKPNIKEVDYYIGLEDPTDSYTYESKGRKVSSKNINLDGMKKKCQEKAIELFEKAKTAQQKELDNTQKALEKFVELHTNNS